MYVCRALIVSPDLPITLPTMLLGQSTVAVARLSWPCPGVPSMVLQTVKPIAWTDAVENCSTWNRAVEEGAHVVGVTAVIPNCKQGQPGQKGNLAFNVFLHHHWVSQCRAWCIMQTSSLHCCRYPLLHFRNR